MTVLQSAYKDFDAELGAVRGGHGFLSAQDHIYIYIYIYYIYMSQAVLRYTVLDSVVL